MTSTRELFELGGRLALVTGGSRGLGLQMAEALGEMGAKLAISARKDDELQDAAARLRAKGIEVSTFVHDLSQADRIPALVDEVLARCGSIDILVNNAGASWGSPAEDHPVQAWHKVMNININAMFILSQDVGRRCMIPRRCGKIINVASIAGLSGGSPRNSTIAYNTSKGAAINFTRTLAAEWGKHNINVNAVCPGFFWSKMSTGLLRNLEQEVVANTPLQRLGGNEDLKGTVVFLASEASRHVTGQYISVDGGISTA